MRRVYWRSLYRHRLGIRWHATTSPCTSLDDSRHLPSAAAASRISYWKRIPAWSEVTESEFIDYKWQMKNSLQSPKALLNFLAAVLPSEIRSSSTQDYVTRAEFIADVATGMKKAPMAVRLTPHILSLINWKEAYSDPIRRQFIPIASSFKPDHPQLQLDSLHETHDSPVKGLVHRYPDKTDSYLATSVCPVYCRFCTRSYSVGQQTETVSKKRFLPLQKYWKPMFEYIARTPEVTDVVVSGGDTFFLEPSQLREIGTTLLGIDHIRRIRFASKGLSVCPSRILDPSDEWTRVLIEISNRGREKGKNIALHTHFNHPQEISWITEQAAQKLFHNAVTVRNQTVLLNKVNNNVPTMKRLIRKLADNNIQPYYVYQGDMVQGVEDLRTPLRDILHIESHIRGTIAGFMTPSFVVDLPGGGGKRLASTFESYDTRTGVSRFLAPGVKGNTVHQYYDPLWSLPEGSQTL
ncbi:hypothetical protein BDV35DRAFT_405017 [Aspergillus flavus]|uniref:L-lysine 2,3-aminomutase n=2 Tax=Aspergillus subgen. Circumdati TaxID=2720871 RepID=A0A5N6HD27_ASPFL|nr:lysine 2,3-aminomutase [Aspergillus oryzae 3.042]KAB8252376.1 hypothetical protein BDV35DRAFT_405017 [Aspergillus flavus]KDE85665.1 lysine 2,3-aminomutase [Aspergillus oryzae 100-8]|eukprot:EIT77244.1 lysine 2,3-aminomutase [Aspergillus oryzae 3.042]